MIVQTGSQPTSSPRSGPTSACATPARASFLLESVEHGRLGRYSLVGCGLAARRPRGGRGLGRAGGRLRLVRPRRAARAHRAAPRQTGPTSPRAASSSPTCSFASTTCRGVAEVLYGDPADVGALLEAPPARSRTARPPRGTAPPPTLPPEYERAVRVAKEHIRAGDAFQIVLSQRAERPTSAGALELYRSLRRVNPSPYLFLLELATASRSSARRPRRSSRRRAGGRA